MRVVSRMVFLLFFMLCEEKDSSRWEVLGHSQGLRNKLHRKWMESHVGAILMEPKLLLQKKKMSYYFSEKKD